MIPAWLVAAVRSYRGAWEQEDEARAALHSMGYTVREDPDHGAYVLDERPDAW